MHCLNLTKCISSDIIVDDNRHQESLILDYNPVFFRFEYRSKQGNGRAYRRLDFTFQNAPKKCH